VNLAGSTFNLDHYSAPAAAKTDKDKISSGEDDKSGDEALIPAGAIVALPGDYHISFKELVVQHLHIAPFDIKLAISPEGILTIKKLEARAYGGEFAMHGTVDARASEPQVAMNVSLNNLSLEPALKDYFQIEKAYASGDFGFESTVTTRGLSYNQLIQALAGDFSFASKKITLNKVDLTSSLDTSLLQILQVKLPKLMSNENETMLSDMVGKGFIQRGVMNNSSLTALGPCLQIDGAGTYNLANADVKYYMDITFPSANTDKLCTDINPKLKDIAWPIACEGSLDDGAAKICGANKAEMQSIATKSLKKEAGKSWKASSMKP